MRILIFILLIWVALIVLGTFFKLLKLAIWVGAIALVVIAVQRLLQGRNILTGEKA